MFRQAITHVRGVRSALVALATPPPPQRFEFRVNGDVRSKHHTYEDAVQEVDPVVGSGEYRTWDIGERIAGRLINVAFGYRGGTTSTIDLAKLGVPIGAQSLSDRAL
jgi:hypothetical protein